MNRGEITKFIVELVSKDSASFADYATELEKVVGAMSLDTIRESLLECGVIPESYGHDSTEEKLYSKYSDILLARAFSFMGIDARVLKERADAADVEGHTTKYTIVADGKVFRLSRTAKNQKDFKVEALDKWRKGKKYACLISPLYQYPKNSSQIYRQAISKNVTLLSYAHLYFILLHKEANKINFEKLWQVPRSLKGAKDAKIYWVKINGILCKILGKKKSDWEEIKEIEKQALKKSAKEETAYINGQIAAIKSLSHEQAIEKLIKSEKLDSKILQIRKISGLKE